MAINFTGSYSENFDSLASTGTSTVLPTDWVVSETGTSANATYTAGTGSANTGDTYSFGAAGSTERALGSLQSGSVVPSFGSSFTNTTGNPITALTVSYVGEQWRLGTAGRADRLDFQYSLDATSLTTGTWVNVDTLDFASPVTTGAVGALDGNAAANRTAVNATISSLNIPVGATFWFRWSSFDAAGADDGLAIDNFSLAANVSTVPTVTIAATDANAAEAGQDPGTFRITRTGDTTSALTVSYTVGGTASTADYTPTLGGSATIAAGQAFVDVTITPVDDAAIEPSEAVTLTLVDTLDYDLGATPTATVTIVDNDGVALPTVTIAASPNSTAEGSTTSGLSTVSRTGDTTNPLTVSFTSGGTATVGSDYLTPASFATNSIEIPAGQSSATIAITPIDDTLIEAVETVSVTLSAAADYTLGAAGNAIVSINDNDIAITKIHDIQGSGTTFNTAFGGTRTIEGIVVGAFQGSTRLNGFYVQEEDADADADAATSEGIFVFDPTGLFSGTVGSKVRITGTVGEFTTTSTSIAGAANSSLTQLSGLTTVLNLGTVALPTVTNVVLPVTDASVLERYEGMLVNISAATGPLTVTETFKLGRFGQVGLSGGDRIDQYTQVNAPSVSGYANYVANLLDNYIILDDGSTAQNPDPEIFARGGNPLSAANTLRGGDTIASISGVLDQRFEGYRVQTTTPANFLPTNAREATSPVVGGTLRVASANLLNFFNGNGIDANNDGLIDGGFPTSRGADTAIEFKRQIDKSVQEVLGLNADVFGYNEMENDGYGSASAIQQLVNALNAATATGTYAFVLPPASALNPAGGFGGDEITVGFIYKTNAARIAPGTSAAALTTGIFDQVTTRVQRPALAVTFERLANGTPTNETFTAVINHFKSKGSAANLPGDADQGDGQGLSNATRTQAAQQLAAWLATNPTGTADPDYLILGDLNAYRLEDPIATLTNAGYTSLFGPESYSYQFNGQWGSLDHALASGSLNSQVTGAAKWHINSDEPIVLDYNTEFKSANQVNSFYSVDPFRTSDHDPIVVGLNLQSNNTAPVAGADLVTTAEDAAVTFNVLTNDTDANGDTLTITSSTATSNGSLVSNGNGSFTYTPGLNFNGSDSFGYIISDGKAGTAAATVGITVTPVNDPAVITGTTTGAVTEDAALSTATGTLSATDVDSPATFVAQANANGTYGSFAIAIDGGWTYSLDNSRTATNALAAGQTVTEVFTVATADGTTQAVTITVNGSNDAPVVSGAVTATATEDAAPFALNLLANASDPDARAALNVANLVLAGDNAAGVMVNGNSLAINPNAYNSLAGGQTNAIRYSYNIVDGSGGSVAQTATVTIQGLNDAPIAAPDLITTTEKSSVSFNVLTNDSDPDGSDRFTLTGFNFGGIQGTATIGSNGSVTYNPGTAFQSLSAGQSAVETLSYTIADTNSASSTGTVNITVTGLNDAPVLNPGLVQNLPTLNEDPAVNAGVLVATFLGSAIADPDANALQGIAVTRTSNNTAWQFSTNGGANWAGFGSVSNSSALLLAANTLVRYNPALNFNGSADLTYRAWDQSTGSVGSKVSTSSNGGATAFSTQTATSGLTVQAVNDAPVNTLPASAIATQGSVLTFSGGRRISISDVDAGSSPLQVSLGVSRGSLTLSGLSGLTFSSGDGTDDANLTFSGTLTVINAALNGLQFTPDAPAVLQGSVTLTLTSDDLGSTGLVTGPTSSTSSLPITVRPGRVVNGTAANNTLNGNGGADFISGLGGNDTIYGNGGSDVLLGGDGNDTIYLGGGTGWIDGGAGSDTIYLGGGNDTIVLAAGNGTDTVYNVPAGSTRFSLSAGLSFGNLSIVQSGNNTLIQTGTETLASLVGVQTSSLTASRFI